jgi:hypothetical protein
MPWVESVSPSFRARHDSAQADEAARILESLEHARERLEDYFPRTLADVTVIVHHSTMSLSLSNPLLPGIWLLTAPASRRYVAGWASSGELHVLGSDIQERRASNVPGSREMLALSAAALYTRRVITENNRALRSVAPPVRVRLELRWAWLIEGAARWFSGQTDHARPAIARRLREGRPPAFPPGVRDAPLLGGTIIDLLAREEGEQAAAILACRFHPGGSRQALAGAFTGRPLVQTEGAWRAHLGRLAGAH